MNFEKELQDFLATFGKDRASTVLVENTFYVLGHGKIFFKIDYPSGRLTQ